MCVNVMEAPKCPKPPQCGECAGFTLDCGGHCQCNPVSKQCEGILAPGHSEFYSTKRKKYGYVHVRVKGPKPHNHAGTG